MDCCRERTAVQYLLKRGRDASMVMKVMYNIPVLAVCLVNVLLLRRPKYIEKLEVSSHLVNKYCAYPKTNDASPWSIYII